jgi:hypothetical protein
MMNDLWTSKDPGRWEAAFDAYETILERQGVDRLPALDRWYRGELPEAMAARDPRHITLDELVRVTEWKMARGVWRGRNLALVKGNAAADVEAASRRALARIPDPTAPIAELARLAGVGPATASAVVAAAAPATYPFLDELVAAQVPGLGNPAFTLGYYRRFAEALCARAATLGRPWTPVRVEQALWARAGGKAGVRLD